MQNRRIWHSMVRQQIYKLHSSSISIPRHTPHYAQSSPLNSNKKLRSKTKERYLVVKLKCQNLLKTLWCHVMPYLSSFFLYHHNDHQCVYLLWPESSRCIFWQWREGASWNFGCWQIKYKHLQDKYLYVWQIIYRRMPNKKYQRKKWQKCWELQVWLWL